MLSEQEVEQLIRTSHLTTTPELDERILAAASRRPRDETAVASSPLDNNARSNGGQSRSRMLVSLVGAAGLLLAMGIWWIARPADIWAQVVQEVRDKPWIHLVGKNPDGDDIEQWFSTRHQISAHRSPQHVSFNDYRAGLTESYDRSSQQVVRSVVDAQSSGRRSFDAFTELFRELFRGAETLDSEKVFGHIADVDGIEQSRREIKDKDGHSYEYRLTLKVGDQQPGSMTIRVDAASLLPRTMTAVDHENSSVVTFRFEYPESGPKDIYELGVPQDAKVVDHAPQTLNGDAKEIVDGVRAAAEGFDDFRVIQVLSKPNLPWHVGTPMLVWRSGNRSRLEVGYVDPDNPPSSESPDASVDPKQWWKDRCQQLWFAPVAVSDGDTLFQNHFMPDGVKSAKIDNHPTMRSPAKWGKTDWKSRPEPRDWPARTTPIVFAYPRNLVGSFASPLYHTEIISKPAEAPPGTLLVKVTSTSGRVSPDASESPDELPSTRNQVEYLVDPARSFVVLRESTSTFIEENGEQIIQSESRREMEGFKQSPKGFWYPTVIQDAQTFPQNGRLATMTTVSRFYFDFDVEMSADLFRPRERQGHGLPER